MLCSVFCIRLQLWLIIEGVVRLTYPEKAMSVGTRPGTFLIGVTHSSNIRTRAAGQNTSDEGIT
jgi:hypothetical protein